MMELKIDVEVDSALDEIDEAIQLWRDSKAETIQDLLGDVPFEAGDIIVFRGREYVYSHAEYAWRVKGMLSYYINAHKIRDNGVMYQRSERLHGAENDTVRKTGKRYAKPVDIEKDDTIKEQNV